MRAIREPLAVTAAFVTLGVLIGLIGSAYSSGERAARFDRIERCVSLGESLEACSEVVP